MKSRAKKILSFVGASVLSLASIFSLAFTVFKNESDLNLQGAETATHGGGGV